MLWRALVVAASCALAVPVRAGPLPEVPCPTAGLWSIPAHELSPADRHELDLMTSPFYRASIAAGEGSWLDGRARDTCFEPEHVSATGVGSDFGPYEGRAETEHFVLQFDPARVTSARAEEELAEFEGAWVEFVEEQGFAPPPGMPGEQLLVFVDPLPAPFLGVTVLWNCGPSFMPYVILSTSYMNSDQSSLAAHEFFHAVQSGYWVDEMIVQAPSPEAWLIESTATWQHTLAHPESHAWNAEQYAPALLARPGLGLRETGDLLAPYSAYLHWLAAEQHLGGPGFAADYFDAIGGQTGWDHQEVWEGVLADRGVAWRDAAAGYLGRLISGDWGVPELAGVRPGRPQSAPLMQGIGDGISARHSRLSMPRDEVLEGVAALGAQFVQIQLDDLSGGLHIELQGQSPADEEWVFATAAVAGGEVVQWFTPVDGRAVLSQVDEFDELLLGALPRMADAGGGAWADTVQRGPPNAEPGLAADVEEGVGCGCGVGARGGGGLALVVLLGRRRRRSTA